MSVDYLLHESSLGYAIFKVAMQPDTAGSRLKEVQKKVGDLALFGKMVNLVSFAPFQGAQQALENANDISEGIVSDYLQTVLEANLPKPGKGSQSIRLGVSDKNLAGSIKASFPKIECTTPDTSEVTADLLRGLRLHSDKLLKQVQEGDVERAQLGLGHSYSRAKVKFSVNRNDNHIIQAIATLDHLDKAINTFSMRVREWYSWHFPELLRIVSDNQAYAKLAHFIGDKRGLSQDSLHDIAALVNDDEAIAQNIIDAAKISMGRDVSEADMQNVMAFAERVIKLVTFRKSLSAYLVAKMGIVAPNLAALIGEVVGARLISHAGSLTTLAKYPASTVQILGAEKALFRALKTKGNTPKYGLIYHSSFIGRAGTKNKGRISRFLANKCSIASRIDNFSEAPSTRFGDALRKQVEERLEFYASGAVPTKNEDVMRGVMESMDSMLDSIQVDATAVAVPPSALSRTVPAQDAAEDKKAKKLRKEEKRLLKEKKAAAANGLQLDADGDLNMDGTLEADAEAARKARKEDKKKRKRESAAAQALASTSPEVEKTEKKKKRKKHQHNDEP